MSQKLILAVGGLPGCGKSEAINYLQEQWNCPKVYFGVPPEVRRRGLEMTQENERMVREELRAKHGMAAMAIINMPDLEAAAAQFDKVLIESMYSWEEYVMVKEKFGDAFKFLAVYAPPALRYERLTKRPERPLTLEQARDRDYTQLTTLNQGAPIAIADFTVINDGTMEELRAQLDEVVAKLR